MAREDGRLADLVVTGKVGKKQMQEIEAACRAGEWPEFIIGGGWLGP